MFLLLATSVRTEATVSCSYWLQVLEQMLQFRVPTTGLKYQDRGYSFMFLLLASSVRSVVGLMTCRICTAIVVL